MCGWDVAAPVLGVYYKVYKTFSNIHYDTATTTTTTIRYYLIRICDYVRTTSSTPLLVRCRMAKTKLKKVCNKRKHVLVLFVLAGMERRSRGSAVLHLRMPILSAAAVIRIVIVVVNPFVFRSTMCSMAC